MSLYTYDNISWNLPLMFCHDDLIFAIGDVLKAFSDIPRPTLYAYGAMSSPWSGGRCTTIKFYDKPFMEQHLNRIIDSGFIPTFTFTKPFIKNDDLQDKMVNWVLDWGVEHDCEFIVTAENLYNHIRERHPEAKLVASILKGKMEFHNPKKRLTHGKDFELNFYNENIDKYHRVVVRPEYNIEHLEQDIPRIKDVSKLEVLLNETCVPHCPFAVKCYSGMDATMYNKNSESRCGREEFNRRHGIQKELSFNLLVKKDFLDHLVYDCGIKHLKVQGRHYYSAYLYNLVLYFLFNQTGEFQTIYDYIINKAKQEQRFKINEPIEQKFALGQLFARDFVDLL